MPATIAAAREHGLQVGVAFNPETEPEACRRRRRDVDLVLCMSIHPGYSGQPFRRRRTSASAGCARAPGDAS